MSVQCPSYPVKQPMSQYHFVTDSTNYQNRTKRTEKSTEQDLRKESDNFCNPSFVLLIVDNYIASVLWKKVLSG